MMEIATMQPTKPSDLEVVAEKIKSDNENGGEMKATDQVEIRTPESSENTETDKTRIESNTAEDVMEDIRRNAEDVKKDGCSFRDDDNSSATQISSTVPKVIATTLQKLKAQSVRVDKQIESANSRLHNHLVQSYLWWRKAEKIEGYIDAEYAKLPLRKSTGKASPNFIPVLRVICGEHSSLNDQDFQRRSRALNALHIEFEGNPEKYRSGRIKKLTHFIKQSGGVIKLAGYALADKGPAEKKMNENQRIGKAQQVAETQAKALEAAMKSAACHGDLGTYDDPDLPSYIPTDDEGFFLVLRKRTPDGSKLIACSRDQDVIEKVLVDTHLRRFEAHDSVTRPLLELIQTQCYPENLKHLASELADPSTVDEREEQVSRAARRVMFLHETDQFLLSPIRAESGVVSLVKPAKSMMPGCKQDVFMPPLQRSMLEQKLLQNFDLSLFASADIDQFPEHEGDNSASHALSLVHHVDSNIKVDLHFWPFYETFSKPLEQVALNAAYQFEEKWQATLPACYFQKLADQNLDPWLNGLGSHAKRKQHKILYVTFETSCLDIKFNCNEDGELEGHEIVEFDSIAGSEKSLDVQFLSKDWILALRSIAHLPVEGDVSLAVSDDVMRISFKTVGVGGAEHEIHIPTVDADGIRSTAPFQRYQPDIVPDDTIQAFDPEENDLLAAYADLEELEVQL